MKSRLEKGCFIALLLVAGSFAVHAEEVDRKGQFGIGPDFSNLGYGIGVRYWLTDKFALNGGGFFSVDDGRKNQSNKSYGADALLGFVLKKKGLLRLSALAGCGFGQTYWKYESADYRNENTIKDVNVGIGLSAEYSFAELPDLGFEAFATGFGADFIKETTETTLGGVTTTDSDTYVRYSSSPRIGMGIRYYF